jgi:hypothetical protein
MSRWLSLAYPALLGVACVFSLYADTPVSLPQTFRALAVAVGAAGVVQLVLSLVLRSALAGALGATFLVLWVMFGWILLAPLTAVVVWEWLRLRLSRTRRLTAPSLAAFLHSAGPPVATALLTAAVAVGIINGAIGLPRLPAATAPTAVAVDGPDVFVVLLDAYARGDTLAEFGYNNNPFLDGLKQRGFQVAEHSRSNYSRTGLTLASMFNMAHVADIPALSSRPEGYNQQHRLVGDTLHAGNPALDELHRSGYETFYIPSRAAQYAVEPVEHMLAGTELDNFEVYLVTKTIIGPLLRTLAPTALYDQQRDRTRDSFATLARIASEPAPRPRFVFAHLMTPHPPFVFDRDGGTPPLPPCYPGTCGILDPPRDLELYRSRYVDQLAYTNELVLAAVDAIIAAQSDAVVVLMSDHGSRLVFSDFAESTRNLMAIRADRIQVPDTMTPISLFPLLFNAYLGTALGLPAARSFASLERTPWPLVEVP